MQSTDDLPKDSKDAITIEPFDYPALRKNKPTWSRIEFAENLREQFSLFSFRKLVELFVKKFDALTLIVGERQ